MAVSHKYSTLCIILQADKPSEVKRGSGVGLFLRLSVNGFSRADVPAKQIAGLNGNA